MINRTAHTFLPGAILSALTLFVISCSSTAPPYLVTAKDYRIYSVADHKEVALSDVTAAMASHDVTFFGEEHDDLVCHAMERTLLEELSKSQGKNVALSLEMFDREAQLVVDEYLHGL